jgi:hypothetical protein
LGDGTTTNAVYSKTIATCPITLPVTFLDAYASMMDSGDILIRWSTIEEEHNDYFLIQHSRDITHFRTIAEIEGAGDYAGIRDYQYIHSRLSAGNHYYRIAQVDYDGGVSYSDVFSVTKVHELDFYIRSLGNGIIEIQFLSSFEADCRFQVITLEGTLVQTKRAEQTPGKIRFEVPKELKGMYLFSFYTHKEKHVQRILIK